jgi:hypothetical protein
MRRLGVKGMVMTNEFKLPNDLKGTLVDPRANQCVLGLLETSGVTGIRWDEEGIRGEVEVPQGLRSLFKSLQVEVHWRNREGNPEIGPWALVNWDYTHPGGGTNGYTIGRIGYDRHSDLWWYRATTAEGATYIA